MAPVLQPTPSQLCASRKGLASYLDVEEPATALSRSAEDSMVVCCHLKPSEVRGQQQGLVADKEGWALGGWGSTLGSGQAML